MLTRSRVPPAVQRLAYNWRCVVLAAGWLMRPGSVPLRAARGDGFRTAFVFPVVSGSVVLPLVEGAVGAADKDVDLATS
jgi:hypothetical protein